MIERINLAHLPTPIEALPRLSSLLNGPQIYIKRDDQTGLAMGGNKTRKMEFLLADALGQGAKLLLSAGAVQSNHCRQVAAAAAKYGLGCTLILTGEPPAQADGNLLLDEILGAQIIFTSRENRDRLLQETYAQAEAAGQYPYLIPYGGSNATGALAYAAAFEEMMNQGIAPDWVIFASSSGGTQAGMILGAHITGFKGKILGISVDVPTETLQQTVAPLVAATAQKRGMQVDCAPTDVLVNADYIGRGYGIVGQGEIEAIELFARNEGILLDPVYTGRAAAGMIDLVRKGQFKPEEKLLFWHTGGTPALFAQKYSRDLSQAV